MSLILSGLFNTKGKQVVKWSWVVNGQYNTKMHVNGLVLPAPERFGEPHPAVSALLSSCKGSQGAVGLQDVIGTYILNRLTNNNSNIISRWHITYSYLFRRETSMKRTSWYKPLSTLTTASFSPGGLPSNTNTGLMSCSRKVSVRKKIPVIGLKTPNKTGIRYLPN